MTSQNVYEHMILLILARKMKQNRKHDISWFSVHADNQQAWHFMILEVSVFIFKTPARINIQPFQTTSKHQTHQNTTVK